MLPQIAIDLCWQCVQSNNCMYFINALTKETSYQVPPSFVKDFVSFYQFKQLMDQQIINDENLETDNNTDSIDAELLHLYNNALIQTKPKIKIKFQFNNTWTLIKLTNEEFFFWNSRDNYSQWECPPLYELNRINDSSLQQIELEASTQNLNNVNMDALHSNNNSNSFLNIQKKETPEEKFIQLLKDNNVTKLTTFDSIQSKIKNDPRFHVLNPKDRKIVFMKYVRQLLKENF